MAAFAILILTCGCTSELSQPSPAPAAASAVASPTPVGQPSPALVPPGPTIAAVAAAVAWPIAALAMFSLFVAFRTSLLAPFAGSIRGLTLPGGIKLEFLPEVDAQRGLGPFPAISALDAASAYMRSDATQNILASLSLPANPGEPIYVKVDLSRRTPWLTTRLYIWTTLLGRLGRRAYIAFVESTDDGSKTRRLIGAADVHVVSSSLAVEYPSFPAVYYEAFRQLAPTFGGAGGIPAEQLLSRFLENFQVFVDKGQLVQGATSPSVEVWMPSNTFSRHPQAEVVQGAAQQAIHLTIPRNVFSSDFYRVRTPQFLPYGIPLNRDQAEVYEYARELKRTVIEDLLGTGLWLDHVDETDLNKQSRTGRAQMVMRCTGDVVAVVDREMRLLRIIDRRRLVNEAIATVSD